MDLTFLANLWLQLELRIRIEWISLNYHRQLYSPSLLSSIPTNGKTHQQKTCYNYDKRSLVKIMMHIKNDASSLLLKFAPRTWEDMERQTMSVEKVREGFTMEVGGTRTACAQRQSCH
jgi:hypothetical protein